MNRKLFLSAAVSSLLILLAVSISHCNSSYSTLDISVPFHYQSNAYYCGPAALEMIFDYYGEDISQIEIADVARTHPYETYGDELRRAAHFSNLSTSLGDEMPGNITGYSNRELGYAAFEGCNLKLDDVKDSLNDGKPLIVMMWWTVSKEYGHYRVVTGYNDTHIIMHDPWNVDLWGGAFGGANTSMTYSTFLDLWNYSDNWGLLVQPMEIEVAASSVSTEGNFGILAKFTYHCPMHFDSTGYFIRQCKATVEMPEGLELAPEETIVHSLGSVKAGGSVQTSWSCFANGTGSYNISVVVTGVIEGCVGECEGYPFYTYEDEISGLCARTLSLEYSEALPLESLILWIIVVVVIAVASAAFLVYLKKIRKSATHNQFEQLLSLLCEETKTPSKNLGQPTNQ